MAKPRRQLSARSSASLAEIRSFKPKQRLCQISDHGWFAMVELICNHREDRR